MYVTGVGHTSLSSASIRSGEIIIPIKMWHQRATFEFLREVQLYNCTLICCTMVIPVVSFKPGSQGRGMYSLYPLSPYL